MTSANGNIEEGTKENVHSTLLKGLDDFAVGQRLVILQEKLVVPRDKLQVASNAPYPKGVEADCG